MPTRTVAQTRRGRNGTLQVTADNDPPIDHESPLSSVEDAVGDPAPADGTDAQPVNSTGGGAPDDEPSEESSSSGSDETPSEPRSRPARSRSQSQSVPPDLQIWDELDEMWNGEQAQIEEMREAGRAVIERASAAERRMQQSRQRYGTLLARLGMPRPGQATPSKRESDDGILARATKNLDAPRGADEDSPQYRRRQAAARRMSESGALSEQADAQALGAPFSPRSRNVLRTWREHDMRENGFSNIPSMSPHGSRRDSRRETTDWSKRATGRSGTRTTGGNRGGSEAPPPSPSGSDPGDDPSGRDDDDDGDDDSSRNETPTRRAPPRKKRRAAPAHRDDSSEDGEVDLDEEYDRRGTSSQPSARRVARRESAAPRNGDGARGHTHDVLHAYRV
ncbi:hypothetical protein FA95DRAFT_1613563 [Auriscalpium vulgare]|uniref:Uncharacterized protein n=1 Tax=Auriscalpium vulgare TaxID=40419 RepID=A0ACB8R2P7_9AGAM|nr:hypothetical protein FA95DRAFT_1613563 [Auriscalpium vulgare]